MTAREIQELAAEAEARLLAAMAKPGFTDEDLRSDFVGLSKLTLDYVSAKIDDPNTPMDELADIADALSGVGYYIAAQADKEAPID